MSTRLYIAIGALVTAAVLASGLAVILKGAAPSRSSTQAPAIAQPELSLQQDAAQPDSEATGVIAVSSQAGIDTYSTDGKLISRDAWRLVADLQLGRSPGGWIAARNCLPGSQCQLLIGQGNGSSGSREVRLPASLVNAVWAPDTDILAIETEGGALSLYDAASDNLTLVAPSTSGWLWSGANLTYMTTSSTGSTFWSFNGSGTRAIATTGSPVSRFYASPSVNSLAFVCSAHDGWTLSSLDLASGSVTGFGNIGAVKEKGVVAADPPEVAISWSPDEKLIAVSPVSAPYVLHLLAADGSSQKHYFFDEGYAGELKWAPGGSVLAVSTYSPDRSRHEVYLLDTASGQSPRHLLDGCHIEWSPDSRFMAVKREPSKAKGVSAIRIADGANWPVAAYTGFVPVSWGVDERDAMTRAMRPVNASAVLGK